MFRRYHCSLPVFLDKTQEWDEEASEDAPACQRFRLKTLATGMLSGMQFASMCDHPDE